MTQHVVGRPDRLRHEKHERAEIGSTRNGTRSKTVLIDVGPVEFEVPRDRAGSFEPQIVKKAKPIPVMTSAPATTTPMRIRCAHVS